MAQCRKCRQFIAANRPDEVQKCKHCDAVYHKKCAGKHGKKLDVCEDCAKQEASPAHDNSSKVTLEKNATVESMLEKVNQKLDILYSLQSKIDKLTEDVSFYSEQYQKLFEFKGVAENKIKALENKNVHLETCYKALEERMALLESKEKEKNVEIYGVNWEKEEDVTSTVKNIAINLGLDPNAICEVKRVGEYPSSVSADRNENGEASPRLRALRPRSLIVTLSSRAARQQWLSKRKTKLTNADVYGKKGDTTPMYINEDLTKYMKQLLWRVKNKLKPEPFKYVWVQDGKILLKRDDPNNKKITAIRTAEDIVRIKAAMKWSSYLAYIMVYSCQRD